MENANTHVAFCMASLGGGGIGRMRLNLSRELLKLGARVDLVLGDTGGPYFERLDAEIRCFRIGSTHKVFGPLGLARYLRRHRPDILVTERIRVNAVAHRARKLARSKAVLLAGVHTHMSLEIENLKPHKRAPHFALMRRYYPRNDGFVAVSNGVAEDLASLLEIPRDRIKVAPNPVITPEVHMLARETPPHPWLQDSSVPVILASGRLEPQKDFETLIRAFAQVRRAQPARLILLGQGSLKPRLEALVAELGLVSDVAFPGFVANPYVYMAHAALFVLSSAWEGSPNVLTEALALGLPAVATDCPSGPREILQDGKIGPLVGVGDVAGMAAAISRALQRPPPSKLLASAVDRYTAENSALHYYHILEEFLS